MKNKNELPEQCVKMAKVSLIGDITPPTWRKYLKIPNKPTKGSKVHRPERIDHHAITILAELSYWQRPSIIRDEATGAVIGMKKRFKNDKIQKSYADLAESHTNGNKRQVKEATDRLEDLGLIIKEFRTIKVGNILISNVLFIEVNADAVDYISNTIPTEDMSYETTKEVLHCFVTPPTPNCNTYTETTPEITPPETKVSVNSLPSQTEKKKNLGVSNGVRTGEADHPLRGKANKVPIRKSKKMESYECPNTVKPFLDSWMKYTGKNYRKHNKGSPYAKDCQALHKAILGKFFDENNTPTVDSNYYQTKLTLDDWIFVLKRFSLTRNNADYWPKDKKYFKSLTAKSFLYNADSKAKMKSQFVHYVENEPKLLSDSKQSQTQDNHPTQTNLIIREARKYFGWDLDNGKRDLAIKAGRRLNEFFDQHKKKILSYDYFYQTFNQKAAALFQMLESNDSPDYPVKDVYICSDLTYDRFLPEYLKEMRVYKS